MRSLRKIFWTWFFIFYSFGLLYFGFTSYFKSETFLNSKEISAVEYYIVQDNVCDLEFINTEQGKKYVEKFDEFFKNKKITVDQYKELSTIKDNWIKEEHLKKVANNRRLMEQSLNKE